MYPQKTTLFGVPEIDAPQSKSGQWICINIDYFHSHFSHFALPLQKMENEYYWEKSTLFGIPEIDTPQSKSGQ